MSNVALLALNSNALLISEREPEPIILEGTVALLRYKVRLTSDPPDPIRSIPPLALVTWVLEVPVMVPADQVNLPAMVITPSALSSPPGGPLMLKKFVPIVPRGSKSRVPLEKARA